MVKRKMNQSEPLKITCTSVDCENNLHCFKKTREMEPDEVGQCRECGVELVDWQRVHNRDINDVNYTFMSLKYEMYRHHFWHKEIDQHAVNYALRKGRTGMKKAIHNRVEKALAPAKPFRDGTQTPLTKNPIYYGQHALACCCRKCLNYWHGIQKDRMLSEEEILYIEKLLFMYIEDRIPDISEHGIYVPPIKR